jgi:hypothetical protein
MIDMLLLLLLVARSLTADIGVLLRWIRANEQKACDLNRCKSIETSSPARLSRPLHLPTGITWAKAPGTGDKRGSK